MTPAIDKIVIRDFPQLALIAWNRRPDDVITGEDAFALYEANWRFIEEDRLQPRERDMIAGVPTLSRTDMYAEKLLANADRYNEKSTASRDIIDLAMMIAHWGRIPPDAWDKAWKAYGASVDQAYRAAVDLACERAHLAHCLQKMHMDPALVERIPDLLRNGS